jgi:hypothetical protein
MRVKNMKNKLPWILLIAIFAIAAKITTNELKIGRKQAEDISLEFDKGDGATNPLIKWDDAAANFKFSNDGTNFFEFGSGSGSGEINYVDNWDFETDTATWATYADAAGSTPVDGTGGSANITIAAQASTVLRDGKSLQLTKDAVDRQGEGFSYDFTIAQQDINKKLKIQFDFKTDEDAAYASGDLAVYIYDVTNTAVITPVDTDIISGQNIFQTSFVSTGSTSYRLIFHIATTNASAWDAYIDNVIVGPGMTSQGAAVGGWTAFTPSSTWSTNTVHTAYFRRVGDTMEVQGKVELGGAPDTAILDINIPGSLTIDSTVLQRPDSGSATAVIGEGSILDDGLRSIKAYVVYLNNTTIRMTYGNIVSSLNTSNAEITQAAPMTFANNDAVVYQYKVPITEWAGKGIVPMLAEDNLSEWASYTPITDGFGTISANNLEYRRVGDSLEIRGDFTTGSTTATEAQLGIPSGLTIGGIAGTTELGSLLRDTSTTSRYVLRGLAGETFLTVRTTVNLVQDAGENGGALFGTSERLTVQTFLIPIQEWAGSQNSLVGYTIADETQAGLVSTGAQTFGGDKTFNNSLIANDPIVANGTLVVTVGTDQQLDATGINHIECDPSGGAIEISGMSGGVSGQVIYLTNVSLSSAVTLRHNTGSGAEDEKFVMPNGVTYTVSQGGGIFVYQDGPTAANSKWIFIGAK